MRNFLLLMILLLTACSDDKTTLAGSELNQNSSAINGARFHKSADYQIALVDSQEAFIQRIFVAIDSHKVNDTSLIRKTVCELENSYSLDVYSNISFFSDVKYANYKTDLFTNDNHLLPTSEFRRWMDDYYLGEYEFKTGIYSTFPGSSKAGRKKTFKINSCP